MQIDWDPIKNDENIRRHHLDFSDGWEIFEGPMFTEIDDRYDYGEVRTKGIGFLRDLIVVIIFTEINDYVVRMISFRRAIKYEREQFYKYLRYELGSSEIDV